jgi:hypothetical protein
VTVAEPELTPIAEKAADRAPAAMLTVAGTVTAPEEESSETIETPDAGADRVTVHVLVCPGFRLDGAHSSDCRLEDGAVDSGLTAACSFQPGFAPCPA